MPLSCQDFIIKMLDKDPLTRITVAQILTHPYIVVSLNALSVSNMLGPEIKSPLRPSLGSLALALHKVFC